MREIVLLMTPTDAVTFAEQVGELRREGETVVETLRRVVAEAAQSEKTSPASNASQRHRA